MKIKLTEKQSCRLKFIHISGEPSELFIAMNPLTGDWLQIHKIGDKESAYYGTKSAALTLANNIVKKSAEKNLSCEIDIKNV